ncbi:MAG: ABC transporter ATP-binding protein, partial [Verrucomicrobiota bacterium]|nr:ABC transporter ATP-binding protein [Verrucomicrobiota bacterium]
MPLLDVRNLTTRFHTRTGVVHAVEGVSFSVEAGQTIGIVGESGSGKSVTCYSLLGLIPQPPGRIHSGTAIFNGSGGRGGIDLLKSSEKELRGIRGKKVSMIFQDPMTSLNPYLRISRQLTEPLEIHEGLNGEEALKRAIESLEEVGIPEASKRIHSYPHEFSGGMRQRVVIALALSAEPELIIADEPTTALDVSVQAQVL